MRFVEKVFGVFERLHLTRDFAGTGIGPSIIHRIVQRHGRRIWAEAELDRGAAFYLFLYPVINLPDLAMIRSKADAAPEDRLLN